MTPARLVQCLEILRWPSETLAEALECDEGLVEAWLFGLEEMPMKVGAWLEILAQYHAAAETMKPASVRGRKAKG